MIQNTFAFIVFFIRFQNVMPSAASKRGHETKISCSNRVPDMTYFAAKHYLKFDSCLILNLWCDSLL